MENQNENSEVGSKELLNDVVKDPKQGMVETLKYPGIKLVSRFARFVGIVLFLMYFVMAFVGVFSGGIYYFLQSLAIGFVILVIGFLLGDLLQVLVDIEKNTNIRLLVQRRQILLCVKSQTNLRLGMPY